MNQETPRPSREEIEARLTALLLGELPADEAALLRWAITQDAELARLHDRLKLTIGFVREVAANPAEATPAHTAPLKLSDERREKLLAHFKTITPEEMGLKRFKISRLVEIAAVLAVVAVLAAMLLPSLASAKRKSQRVAALSQKKMQEMQAEGADQVYARERAVAPPATPPRVVTAPPPPTQIVLPQVQNSLASVPGQSKELFGAIGASSDSPNVGDAWFAKGDAARDSYNLGVNKAGLPSEAPALQNQFHQFQNGGGGNGPITQTINGNWMFNEKDELGADAHLAFENRIGGGAIDQTHQSFLADRPRTENKPASGRDGGVLLGALANGSDTFIPNGIASASAGKLSGDISVANGVAVKGLFDDNKQGSMDFNLISGGTVSRLPADINGRLFQGESVNGTVTPNSATVATPAPLPPSGTISGSGMLAMDGNNTYNAYNGVVMANGGSFALDDRKFDTGLTKDDVSGLRYLINNNDAQIDQRQAGDKRGRIIASKETGEANQTLNFATGNVSEPKKLGEEYRNDGSVPSLNVPVDQEHMHIAGLQEAKLDVSKAESPHGFSLLGPIATPGQQIERRKLSDEDRPLPKASLPAPIPQPEILTRENAFSTFSLNVSDVSFKLAAASLEKGQLPDAASIRSEEFINGFDYRDPEAAAGVPVAFASERARYPFAHNRELLRFSVKTAAQGRQAGRPLNLVLLLDNSGSMERADRVAIIHEALRVLAAQLQPQDKISIITFARTPRLWVDGVSGDKAGESLDQVGGITPEGGTNLEEAMNLAYQTALRHYLANGANRVVLLTDGAANLGNVEPEALKQKVEVQRKQGIALDCFGIGWEGFNDDLLEILSRNGDGRYGFINTPEEAATGFAGQLAGALKVAASDVKVQVEFNPKRVTSYRQIGYAKHQLTKQQFRDNTVDAAEIAAQEAGNALYTIETNPSGEGPVATVRVRYKIPGTTDYREQAWDVPYTGNAVVLEQSSPAMRLAATASAFSEWLASSPFAQEVTPDQLLNQLRGVPQVYGADTRPQKLEWMIRQAKSLSGK